MKLRLLWGYGQFKAWPINITTMAIGRIMRIRFLYCELMVVMVMKMKNWWKQRGKFIADWEWQLQALREVSNPTTDLCSWCVLNARAHYHVSGKELTDAMPKEQTLCASLTAASAHNTPGSSSSNTQNHSSHSFQRGTCNCGWMWLYAVSTNQIPAGQFPSQSGRQKSLGTRMQYLPLHSSS